MCRILWAMKADPGSASGLLFEETPRSKITFYIASCCKLFWPTFLCTQFLYTRVPFSNFPRARPNQAKITHEGRLNEICGLNVKMAQRK